MAEAPSASSNPPTGVTHQQVMSRPSGVVLEGETSGPNYGAVNGAQPERTSQRRGASTVLPLGRQTQMLGPDTGDSSGQAVPAVPVGGPVTVSDRAGASVLRLPTGSAERVAVLETERTGPGATEQRQHAHTHVHIQQSRSCTSTSATTASAQEHHWNLTATAAARCVVFADERTATTSASTSSTSTLSAENGGDPSGPI